MQIKILGILAFFIGLTLAGCGSGDKSSARGGISTELPEANNDFFQEIAGAAGLDFTHSIGEEELNNIIESDGGGAVFLDYDQDGFIDIYACSGTWIEGLIKTEKPDVLPGNHLYRNMGDGTFQDVTKKPAWGGHGTPWEPQQRISITTGTPISS